MCDTFIILLILYSQIISNSMGTYCAPLIADLFFYFVMRETSCCLFLTKIKLMFSSARYLDDLLNNDNHFFEQMAD